MAAAEDLRAFQLDLTGVQRPTMPK